MSHSHIKALNDRVAGLIAERDALRASNAELREVLKYIRDAVDPIVNPAVRFTGADSTLDLINGARKADNALAKTPADTGSELNKLRAQVEKLEGMLGKAAPLIEASHEIIKRDGDELALLREDKARLDFIEKLRDPRFPDISTDCYDHPIIELNCTRGNANDSYPVNMGKGTTVREAIDNAMKQEASKS